MGPPSPLKNVRILAILLWQIFKTGGALNGGGGGGPPPDIIGYRPGDWEDEPRQLLEMNFDTPLNRRGVANLNSPHNGAPLWGYGYIRAVREGGVDSGVLSKMRL